MSVMAEKGNGQPVTETLSQNVSRPMTMLNGMNNSRGPQTGQGHAGSLVELRSP